MGTAVNVFAGDVRFVAEVNGRKSLTLPIVRARKDGMLLVDEGLFATAQTGSLMTMSARVAYQTPAKGGKGLLAAIQRAEAIAVVNIPGRRLPDGRYTDYEPGLIVKLAEADAQAYAVDACAVRVFETRATNAPVKNVVTGVIAVELEAYALLMANNTNQNWVVRKDAAQPIDAGIWEEGVAAVVAAGKPVVYTNQFRDGTVAQTNGLPRGDQRAKALAEANKGNAEAIANDPINAMSVGTYVAPVAAVTAGGYAGGNGLRARYRRS